jgi:DNA-binding transcriptional regulator YiaG
MKDADFQNLLQGVRELAEAREGHLPKGTHSDHLAEDDVAVVRARLGFSQSQFAKVSTPCKIGSKSGAVLPALPEF